MIKALSLIVFSILTIIALLHAYWAFGGLWPATTEKDLIDIVVGVPEMTQMFGKGPTLIVAGWIFTAGLIALRAGGVISIGPRWAISFSAAILTLIFTARGLMGYVASWTSVHSAEPFATYDPLFYSPLCLALGFGFFLLSINTRL